MRDDCDFTKSYLFIPFFTFWVFRSFIQLLVIHSLFPVLPFFIDVVPVTVARNLGTWFDSNLNLQEQIHKTCKSGFFHLYNIRRIRKYLSQESARTLVHAFIIGRIDYCNSLLFGLPSTHLLKLQRLQNAAIRLISNVPRHSHITPVLCALH